MRGSPSCVIAVRRFTVWRAAIAAVTLPALASLIAWLVLAPAAHVAVVGIAATLFGLTVIAWAASLLRTSPVELRWDGSTWSRRSLAGLPAAPASGELDVAIDLGSFLLLRFAPHSAGRWRPMHWIPVERRGLEREWHSFRCAVYSPRPAAGTASAAASPHP
jgi:xanthosine utilization system XapX-like protein